MHRESPRLKLKRVISLRLCSISPGHTSSQSSLLLRKTWKKIGRDRFIALYNKLNVHEYFKLAGYLLTLKYRSNTQINIDLITLPNLYLLEKLTVLCRPNLFEMKIISFVRNLFRFDTYGFSRTQTARQPYNFLPNLNYANRSNIRTYILLFYRDN